MRAKKNSTVTLLLLALLALPVLSGCSLFSTSSESTESSSLFFFGKSSDGGNVNVSEYTPDSLLNYQLGRNYAASGRYELAREHYLIALAAANTQELQEALSQELRGIDLMIKSLR
ncbi:hypothetical protein LJC48_00655 [Desulfovibrio sp. OttesenSCG-928-C06]|nr:hypothetical protein [Desulfovibrio sp. OttesenSCG-928-C06]